MLYFISTPRVTEKSHSSRIKSFALRKNRTVKRIITLLCPIALIFFTNINTYNTHQNFRVTDKSSIGMLQYLPEDYHDNSDKYPLVIFLHGIIEKGINSNDKSLLESTIHPVDNLGPPKHVKEGYKFPFILISPQLKNHYESWPSWYVLEVVEWAKQNLRVDEKRIHITGLSLGGGGVFEVIQDHPEVFASAVPICAYTNRPELACNIAKENIGVWAFHGEGDPQVPYTTASDMIQAIQKCTEGKSNAMATIYPDLKHNVWDRAYTPDHTYHYQNLYDWMMSMYNVKTGDNHLPTANAGTDVSSDRPTTITLSGAGKDPDGRINSYHWAKISGPSVAWLSAGSQSVTVSLSDRGVYTFKLTVTDNAGGTDSDYVKVSVYEK
jgi:hypothetical protein